MTLRSKQAGKQVAKRKDTKIAEAGRRPEWTLGAVNPPVFHVSTVLFDTHADLREAVRDSENRFFYGRKGSPTLWALADAVAEMEGGAGGKVYPSGIAAITTALLSCLSSGDHVLLADCVYEPVRFVATRFLKRMGIEAEFFDPTIGEGIAKQFRPNTRAILLESPGSLTFEFQDLPAIANAAHQRDIVMLVDNTWATPYFHNPLKLGADIVIHAATKYIVGHSDAMLGVAVANETRLRELQRASAYLGQVAGPDDAYLGLRGLRTIGVRLERHQENARRVAAWLRDHDAVYKVLFPEFDDCPGHDIWKRDFTGANGLFSFILKNGDYDQIGALTDGLDHFGMGFSWGGYESLILPQDPARVRSATEWSAPGPLIRLHVGLEDPDDLIADLDKGLANYTRTTGVG